MFGNPSTEPTQFPDQSSSNSVRTTTKEFAWSRSYSTVRTVSPVPPALQIGTYVIDNPVNISQHCNVPEELCLTGLLGLEQPPHSLVSLFLFLLQFQLVFDFALSRDCDRRQYHA